MKILLIAGHGAGDPGAVAAIDGTVHREADLTRALAARVKKLLSGYADVDTYPTDRNAFTDYKSGVLAKTANFAKYDYVFEIHFNAGTGNQAGDGRITGTECYVTTAENSVGVETAIVENISRLGFTNRGVKRTNFAVIRTAKRAGVSAALLETCFIDDADDMRLYVKKQAEVAAAIAEGILSGFGLKRPQAVEQEEDMTEAQVRKICKEVVQEVLTGKNTVCSSWAKEELAQAVASGITDGLRPGGYATREHAAVMVQRAIDKLNGDGATVSKSLAADFAEAVELGITDGTRPQGYAKREEVVAMVMRSMKGQ